MRPFAEAARASGWGGRCRRRARPGRRNEPRVATVAARSRRASARPISQVLAPVTLCYPWLLDWPGSPGVLHPVSCSISSTRTATKRWPTRCSTISPSRRTARAPGPRSR
ncbi:hypothetical protein VP95_05795 [Burkholderia pseudomallei]|nr:hypothetical protein VP95_05795 [Burkholderia pseudomallei]